MARQGQFTGPTFEWNAPLSVVHPPDNLVKDTQYHENLRQVIGDFTAEQLLDLEQQIRELEAVLREDRQT